MLQTVGKHGRLIVVMLLLLTGASHALAAQGNRYRAELVLIQRVDSAQGVSERMQSRHPSTPDDITKTLLALNASGQAYSDLNLVSPNELYLSTAAQRLKNSGRFRILMQAGWYQSFPPDYKGERMRVALGDLLSTGEPGEERREVEGYISIDRQRYLHVTAQLNHWEKAPGESASRPASDESTDAASGQVITNGNSSPSSNNHSGTASKATDSPDALTKQTTGGANTESQSDSGKPSAQSPDGPKIQLLTWLHETRRMRSGEIHYLGSPTIGLLVYFAPIDEKSGAQVSGGQDTSTEGTSGTADSEAESSAQ